MTLLKCCTQYASQFEKLSSGLRTGKVLIENCFIPIPKKGNAKDCSNYQTIVLISHDSKVMLKILQARLQQSEKAMAPYSSTLAWKIPWTGKPGGLPSMGSHRVEHDWRDLAAAAAAGFNSTWTMNFQMFKLVLEKAEELEIKLPTPGGSSKKREKHLLLLYWLCQSLCLHGSQ